MDDMLDREARRMLIRFGSRAAQMAADRARDLAGRGDWPAQDRVLLMLTRIERMAGAAP